MRAISPELMVTVRLQHGVVTVAQLNTDGFRSEQVSRLIAQGHWQRITYRVIATHQLPLDRRARLWAAALHYPSCGLAGPSALEMVGLPSPVDARIHIIGARSGRGRPMLDCVTHTITEPIVFEQSPNRVAPAQAVAQALRWAKSDRQGVFHATWAIQHRLVTLGEIELAVHATHFSVGTNAMKRRLALIEPGVQSVNEFDFAQGCRDRGLPAPIRQRLRVDAEGCNRYTDAEFTVAGRTLVVEIDGIQHLDTTVRLDDDWRGNELTLQGTPVLRISSLALRMEPERVFAQVQRALQQLKQVA